MTSTPPAETASGDELLQLLDDLFSRKTTPDELEEAFISLVTSAGKTPRKLSPPIPLSTPGAPHLPHLPPLPRGGEIHTDYRQQYIGFVELSSHGIHSLPVFRMVLHAARLERGTSIIYASLEQVQEKDLHEKYDTLIDSHDDLEKANAELQ
jgi:hypothetical protein